MLRRYHHGLVRRRRAAGARSAPEPVSPNVPQRNRLLVPRTFARLPLQCGHDVALSPGPDIAELIADTEAEILRLVENDDPATAGVYEMVRYHLGPRRLRAVGQADAAAPGPPGLRLDHRRPPGRPCRVPRPSSSATTSASSTTTSRTATASAATGPPCGRSTASPRRSTPATCSSASAGSPSTA